MSLNELCESLVSGDKQKSEELARSLLEQGADPLEVISSLTRTMNEIGDKFSRLEIFLPEMMLSGEAMAAAVEVFAPVLKKSEQESEKGIVVLGTVKGDLHEIGKNIVKMMLEANVFQVKDLGCDVDPVDFIKEAESIGAQVIAASSLMTTTMPHQKEIIDLLEDKGIRDKYKVIIGGGPTTKEWADEIKADMYGSDAGSAPAKIAGLLR